MHEYKNKQMDTYYSVYASIFLILISVTVLETLIKEHHCMSLLY